MTRVRQSKTRKTKYFRNWEEANTFIEKIGSERVTSSRSCRPRRYGDRTTVHTVYVTYKIKPDNPEEEDG